MTVRRCLPWLIVLITWSVSAHAQSALCRSAIAGVESNRRIPDAFLSAIGRVESGRPDPVTGLVAPWPWTINAEGKGSFFETKADAIAAVKALQARGVASIDVGCMQVNLMHHPEAFASLEQAFDPVANATFAGQLLQTLFARAGSWPLAAAAYHSLTPTVGAAYQQRVLAAWAMPDRGDSRAPSRPLAPSSSAPPSSGPPSSGPPSSAPSSALAQAGGATAWQPQAGGDGEPIAPAFGRNVQFARPGLPAVAGMAAMGRSLAAYRAVPTALAYRMPWRRG